QLHAVCPGPGQLRRLRRSGGAHADGELRIEQEETEKTESGFSVSSVVSCSNCSFWRRLPQVESDQLCYNRIRFCKPRCAILAKNKGGVPQILAEPRFCLS